MSAICQQPKSVATFKPRHFSYWGGHNKRRENTNVSRYNLEGGRSRYKMTSEIRLQTLLFSSGQHLTANQIVFFSTFLCSPPIFAISSAWYFWISFQSISYTQGCTYHMVYFIVGYFAEPAVRGDVYFIPMISTLFNQLAPWGDPPTNVCNLGRCINGKFVAVWIFNTGWVLTAWCWVATRAKFGHNFSLYVWRGWP